MVAGRRALVKKLRYLAQPQPGMSENKAIEDGANRKEKKAQPPLTKL